MPLLFSLSLTADRCCCCRDDVVSTDGVFVGGGKARRESRALLQPNKRALRPPYQQQGCQIRTAVISYTFECPTISVGIFFL